MRQHWTQRYEVTPEGCWRWTGALTAGGYGEFMKDGKMGYAHRRFYELHKGAIPEGLHLDHLCRNRACCNPAHLEAVTCRENLLRGVGPIAANAAATHCKAGHAFDEANTLYLKGKYGVPTRKCRHCNADRQIDYVQRKKAAAGLTHNQRERYRYESAEQGL